MTCIRRAEIREAMLLTDIAYRSEAYWGYDSVYMESFKSLYKVTEAFIRNNETFILEEDRRVVGFYGMEIGGEEASLEYLYIEPKAIGSGYGRQLWDHMVDNCKRKGIKEIELVTSPQAKEFYIKMGAVQVGEVASLVIKGRIIPKFVYTFTD